MLVAVFGVISTSVLASILASAFANFSLTRTNDKAGAEIDGTLKHLQLDADKVRILKVGILVFRFWGGP